MTPELFQAINSVLGDALKIGALVTAIWLDMVAVHVWQRLLARSWGILIAMSMIIGAINAHP